MVKMKNIKLSEEISRLLSECPKYTVANTIEELACQGEEPIITR